MNPEFEDCIKRGKIRRFARGRVLVEKELRIASSDLERAKASLKANDYKWATIQSYYSMFHSGRALLYAKDYRERSHHCLMVAIKALYVEKGLLPLYLIEGFAKAKILRENADYYDEWSKIGAERMLKVAEEFLDKSKEILQ